jgi:hypothetical protein
MIDETDYDESEADTGPVPVVLKPCVLPMGELQALRGVPVPPAPSVTDADPAVATTTTPSPAPATGAINLSGKVRAGRWSVLKPNRDGTNRQ